MRKVSTICLAIGLFYERDPWQKGFHYLFGYRSFVMKGTLGRVLYHHYHQIYLKFTSILIQPKKFAEFHKTLFVTILAKNGMRKVSTICLAIGLFL